MKIVIFTSDEANGAMKQFAITVARTCVSLGYDTYIFFPEGKKIDIDKDITGYIKWYKKAKSINPFNREAKCVAGMIAEINPDVLFMPEPAIFTMQVLLQVKGKARKAFVIHDVNPHPSNMGIKKRLTYWFGNVMMKEGFKSTDKVVLMSQNSYSLFCNHYSSYKLKALTYALGAHIPHVEHEIKPVELPEGVENKYVLFFGRIDRYKGIDRLTCKYNEIVDEDKSTLPLVIAGNGNLDDKSLSIISEGGSRILLVNRFIKDEEMVWLFKNCKFIVLPYIEASQSGILPIAYAYGKPVIASNIQGLCENVDHGKTGLLVNNDAELKDALSMYLKGDLSEEAGCCLKYSNEKYNWEKNTQVLIEEIMR